MRWVVEIAFAWLHQFKRLRIRYERRAKLHQGLLELACTHMPAPPADPILKRSVGDPEPPRLHLGQKRLQRLYCGP